MTETTTLKPLAADDFFHLATLAHTIWHQHYSRIITTEQIDYMLTGRYTEDKLQRYLQSDSNWCWLLWDGDKTVGYVSCALQPAPAQMKLEQLYLLAAYKGRGLGGQMLDHVEQLAQQKKCRQLWLTVNKYNHDSVAVYKKRGYSVREEAVFDIGNGYVMDDYVMEKACPTY